jgi:uncharacterized membrane protein
MKRRILEELEEWEDQVNRSELEELRRKLKNGEITEEESRRLEELEEWEQKRNKTILEELRKKLKSGTISDEEMKKLK